MKAAWVLTLTLTWDTSGNEGLLCYRKQNQNSKNKMLFNTWRLGKCYEGYTLET